MGPFIAVHDDTPPSVWRLTLLVLGRLRSLLGTVLLAALAFGALPGPDPAQATETSAQQALMVDHDTGTVLLHKDVDTPVVPASLAKLMTLEVVFHAIGEGRLDLNDEFFVSEHAWRTGGAPSRTATMFAEVNSNIPLSDLLRGIMVQAANDACIAIAEGMAGSEEAFAELMNERAAAIGLQDSVFKNATGLPGPEGQQTSVRDMMVLARHLVDEYPYLYRIFGEPEFTWNGINQRNRNPVFQNIDGIDGLMAGYAEESGFGLVASANNDGRRTTLVVHGLPSSDARVAEARKLFSWASRAFERVELFEAGQPVGQVGVYGGDVGRVTLTGQGPISVLVPRGERGSLRGRIVYTGPLRAPVREGDRVGVLRLQDNDETIINEVPLYAAQSVDVGPLHRRAFDAALELVIGLVYSGVEAATSR